MIRVLYFSGCFNNRKILLEELGMKDGTEQDILSAGFEKQGKEFIPKLNGIFSFALYDECTGCWYCCRDRFGGKGLYFYCSPDGNPFFAGTIKDLLTKADIAAEFCEEMLEVYMSYSYVPGEQTMIRNILKPLPGYLYLFESAAIRKERYFTPVYQIEDHPEDEWDERLYQTFNQVLGEKEKGGSSMLSSGIDSAYLCRSLSVKDTYTAAYSEASFSENEAAEKFSGEIGAVHHPVPVTPEAYLAAVPKLMRALEQPTGDASAVTLFVLCSEISKHTDFCYSGEGIDELFMGYYLKIVKSIPVDQTLLKAEYLGCIRMFTDAEKKRFLKHYVPSRKMEYIKEALALSEYEDRLNQAAMIDMLVWLNGNLLPNLYGIGEATGLNVVTPYLDNRLYDITMTIPSALKHDENNTKKIFRRVVSRVLGNDRSGQPKRGFPVPIRLWIRRPDYQLKIKEAFNSENAARFFKCNELNAFYDAMLSNPDDMESWHGIWCIYCFIIWFNEWISGTVLKKRI